MNCLSCGCELPKNSHKNKKFCSKACKRKNYSRTITGLTTRAYFHMKERSKHKSHIFNLTLKEFKNFANSNKEFLSLFSAWTQSDFKYTLTPTVDRINVDDVYRIGNIQFLTFSDNVIKGNKEDNRHISRAIKQQKQTILEKDGQLLIFESGKKASEYLDLPKNAIAMAICNNTKVKGYKASYKIP